jgi:hypothetical protein
VSTATVCVCVFTSAIRNPNACPCEEAAKQKVEVGLQKEKMKHQALARQVMQSLCIPLAKFESDIALLRAHDNAHVILVACDHLMAKGVSYKDAASAAMRAGNICAISSSDVKALLEELRTNSKALQVLGKSATKSAARA